MPSPAAYSRTQIILHWATVLLVALQVLLEEGMNTAYEAQLRGFQTGFWTQATAWAHVASGGLIFLFAAIRLGLRLTRGVPDLPASDPLLLRRFANGTHWALYVVIFAMPATGALAWFGQVRLAGSAHEALMSLLWVLLVLHVGGALVQHFVVKSDVLSRMLGRFPG